MTQQLIGVGTTANDGTGDPLRTAFLKDNNNETELYGALGSTALKAGNWYLSSLAGYGAGTAPNSTTLRVRPFLLREAVTVDQLAVFVSTLSVGGNVQLALYNSISATNPLPGLLVDKTASLSTTTATSVSGAFGANHSLQPGTYWTAQQHDNATSACSSDLSLLCSSIAGNATLTSLLQTGTLALAGFAITNTFGSWPSDLTSATLQPTNTGTQAAVAFHVLSVP